MEMLKIRNWEKFQHYKDREPPWIKLHRCILNDREFCSLSMSERGILIQIWILACEENGSIKNDVDEIAFRLRSDPKNISFSKFIDLGFLIPVPEAPIPDRQGWSSRYISNKTREFVLNRDENQCVKCGSKNDLEIDHIIPVSKGGDGGPENLQVLCIKCNRKKRVRSTCYVEKSVRSLETETETETEKRHNGKNNGDFKFEKAVKIPPDIFLTNKMIKYAGKQGCDDTDHIEFMFESFKNWFGGTGRKYQDWTKTFYNWILKDKKDKNPSKYEILEDAV